jgi:hypothetical protein
MGIITQGLAWELQTGGVRLAAQFGVRSAPSFPTQTMKLRSRSSVPFPRRLPRPAALGAALLLLAALAVPAGAAIITVSGSLTATTASGGGFINVGDVFDYSFTFNDATTDTDPQTSNAQFGAGVSAVSLQRRVGNTGTWNPSGGSFTTINFVVNAGGESITLQAQGTGFPSINGIGFRDIDLNFAWQSGTRNFSDSGSAQTFAQVVGTSPLSFATADSYLFGEIRNTNFGSPVFTMTVNGGGGASVPEGSALVPFALALGACGVVRFRRR